MYFHDGHPKENSGKVSLLHPLLLQRKKQDPPHTWWPPWLLFDYFFLFLTIILFNIKDTTWKLPKGRHS
jgi:hypothetical protein